MGGRAAASVGFGNQHLMRHTIRNAIHHHLPGQYSCTAAVTFMRGANLWSTSRRSVGGGFSSFLFDMGSLGNTAEIAYSQGASRGGECPKGRK